MRSPNVERAVARVIFTLHVTPNHARVPRWRNRLLHAVLVPAVALVVTAFGGASAQAQAHAQAKLRVSASPVVTFGIGPATAKGVIDGRPYYNFAAAGGAHLADHAIVLNYSQVPLPLLVYATDGYNSFTGAASLLETNKRPTDLGAWTHLLTRPDIVVPARTKDGPGRVVVPFRVDVPKGAEPGDHIAGVVAALRTANKNGKGVQVSLDQRVASQIFLRVYGDLHPGLAIRDLRARYHGTLNPIGRGRVDVDFTVVNTGNVRLGSRQRVAASGLLGSWAGEALTDVPQLAPHGSAHLRTVVRGVWPEIWMRATVRVSTLQLKTDANPPIAPVIASTHFWAVPWTLLLLIVGLLLLDVLHRRRRRSQGPKPDRRHARRGGPQSGAVQPTGAGVARVVAVLLVGLGVLGVAPAQAADRAPYNDFGSVATIALCDRAGHPITSGSTTVRPFVWKAVSSKEVPKDYAAAGRTAKLFVAQPRQGVYPPEWNTYNMTSDSLYPQDAHPTAVATGLDDALNSDLQAFPAVYDGYVQLRLMWGAAQRGLDVTYYATVDLKVEGDHWRTVGPTSSDCAQGKAVSAEEAVAHLNTTPTPPAKTGPARAGGPVSNAPGASSASGTSVGPTAAAGTGSGGATAGSDPRGQGGSATGGDARAAAARRANQTTSWSSLLSRVALGIAGIALLVLAVQGTRRLTARSGSHLDT